MQTTYATIDIGHRGLSALQEKVDALNVRARKHGIEPVTVTTLRTVAFVPLHSKGRFGQSSDLYTVAISGVEPCIAGWRMVGKIEFNADLGNIVKTIGDVQLDPRYRTLGCICEHCNSERRRNDTFILRHADGQEKVVGRNCLADFIRTGDAETLARFAEFVERIRTITSEECEDFEEWGGGCGGRSGPDVKTLDYLAMVSCIVRKFGWVSKGAAAGNEYLCATASIAGMCYWGPCKARREYIERNDLYPTDKDMARARAALDWALTKAGDRDEYLHNIGRLAAAEQMPWKYDGFVASILAAHLRALEQDIERRAKAKEREFVGTVGERLRALTVTVTRVRFTEGMYGTKTIVTMETPVGDKRGVLTWFASGDKDGDLSEGETLVVDATVKKHESDARFGDSTIVSRVTIKDRINA